MVQAACTTNQQCLQGALLAIVKKNCAGTDCTVQLSVIIGPLIVQAQPAPASQQRPEGAMLPITIIIVMEKPAQSSQQHLNNLANNACGAPCQFNDNCASTACTHQPSALALSLIVQAQLAQSSQQRRRSALCWLIIIKIEAGHLIFQLTAPAGSFVRQ